jgi:hypothetical protein
VAASIAPRTAETARAAWPCRIAVDATDETLRWNTAFSRSVERGRVRFIPHLPLSRGLINATIYRRLIRRNFAKWKFLLIIFK